MKKEIYQIGLTLIPGIGDINAKNLVAYCGSAEAVFREKQKLLEKIPGIGSKTAKSILHQDVLQRAEQEIRFIEDHGINLLYYQSESYPRRLSHCPDSPVMLYLKGTAQLNAPKVVSIVGTRNATDYGKGLCQELVRGLAQLDILIVSGLAYGIDICAHKAALAFNLPTVGVVAHGLDRVYPPAHTKTAQHMIDSAGGLLTDYLSGTPPDRENFPSRNRIVAGMADATLVVESARKGGALITAEIANSYSRDVFAVPGKAQEKYSEGCHYLIKTNKAALVEDAQDIIAMMGWDLAHPAAVQKRLFVELNDQEQKIYDMLKENGESSIDFICHQSHVQMSKVASLLLNMEFSGVVTALPGKRYKLN